jgi:hypothetical protein
MTKKENQKARKISLALSATRDPPSLTAAGIRKNDIGGGVNYSDVSNALNVIGSVKKSRLEEKNSTVEELKAKHWSKAIKSITNKQKNPNMWDPVINALTEAENSGTDITWESLSKFDEACVFNQGARSSGSSGVKPEQPKPGF